MIKSGDYIEATTTEVDGDAETTVTVKGTVRPDEVFKGYLRVGSSYIIKDGELIDDWELVEHRPANPPEPGICGLIRTRNGHLWINLDGRWQNLANTVQQTDDYESLDVSFVVFEGGDREFTRKSMGFSMTPPSNSYIRRLRK